MDSLKLRIRVYRYHLGICCRFGDARKTSRGCARFIYETLRASCFLAAYFMRKSKSSFLSQTTGSSSLAVFLRAAVKCLKATRTQISCHQAPLQSQFLISIFDPTQGLNFHIPIPPRYRRPSPRGEAPASAPGRRGGVGAGGQGLCLSW